MLHEISVHACLKNTLLSLHVGDRTRNAKSVFTVFLYKKTQASVIITRKDAKVDISMDGVTVWFCMKIILVKAGPLRDV